MEVWRRDEDAGLGGAVVCSCVGGHHTQKGLTSEDILTDVGLGPSCLSGGAGSLGVRVGAAGAEHWPMRLRVGLTVGVSGCFRLILAEVR